MNFELIKLKYAKNALNPYISKETIEYHYGKHHQTYINNLNNLINGSEFENISLEEIIKKSNGAIFNNAAQVWNHNFYFNGLSPNGGGEAKGQIKELIEKTFGNFENFKNEFTKAALSNFGSGWTWLVKDENGNLAIISTSNANTPLTTNNKALLTIDVWEHAYYIDYRNARANYIENFWKIINWDFVNENL